MRELQVLDDDAGLDDAALAVHQQRELAQRPMLKPLNRMLPCIRPDAAGMKGVPFSYSAMSTFCVYEEKGSP